MKFTVEKNILLRSLSHVQSIVEKRNTLQILSNILIEAKENSLILSATDMDISITDKINCNILEEGSTTVSAHTLYDIIRKLHDTSEIEIFSNDGKLMSLRSGQSKFSLGCLPKDEFPIIEINNLENELIINSQKFLKLIDKTRFAVSNEETRYFLNGVYFHKKKDKKLTLVATDGHRLAKFDFNFDEDSNDSFNIQFHNFSEIYTSKHHSLNPQALVLNNITAMRIKTPWSKTRKVISNG